MSEAATTSYKDIDAIKEPYAYLLQVPGKKIRSRLIDAFNTWLKIPDEAVHEIKAVTQMLHTASLLLDDIEDNSELRRGIPVAHHIYGIPSTINCANYVMFLALQRTMALQNAAALQGFTEEMLRLHEGQGFDILWRDANECPTLEDYARMVKDKTGGLFRLAVRMMQAHSENKEDFIPLVDDLGLFFQIQDDYMNLQSDEYHKNKSFAEDLTEGKFSFPIIYSIQQSKGDHRLRNILKQRTKDDAVKHYAVKYMSECGAFEYTKTELLKIRARLDVKLAALGGNAPLTAILDYLSGKIWREDEGEPDPSSPTPQPWRHISSEYVQL